MARINTPWSMVATATATGPSNPAPPIENNPTGTLEGMSIFSRSRNLTEQGRTMLQLIIFKSQNGPSLVDQFSNSYLFSGAGNYLSPGAEALATALRNHEGTLYHDTTFFMRASIMQLDADGNHVEGETRTVDLSGTGAVAMPETSVIVPPHHVVAFKKKVNVGKPGITLYRNMITADEYNAWLEAGTVPARFSQAWATGLMNIGNASGFTMILPRNTRYSGGAERPVTQVQFAGIRTRQETYQKDTGTENLVEAAQQIINENGRAIRRMLRQLQNATGGLAVSIGQGIVQLVLDAVAKYSLLAIARRAAIRWPAIYFAAQLISLLPPGTLPALPSGG